MATFANICQNLEGSFSALSKPIFASIYSQGKRILHCEHAFFTADMTPNLHCNLEPPEAPGSPAPGWALRFGDIHEEAEAQLKVGPAAQRTLAFRGARIIV